MRSPKGGPEGVVEKGGPGFVYTPTTIYLPLQSYNAGFQWIWIWNAFSWSRYVWETELGQHNSVGRDIKQENRSENREQVDKCWNEFVSYENSPKRRCSILPA